MAIKEKKNQNAKKINLCGCCNPFLGEGLLNFNV